MHVQNGKSMKFTWKNFSCAIAVVHDNAKTKKLSLIASVLLLLPIF